MRAQLIGFWKSWYASKAPSLQFTIKFCSFVLLFSSLSFVPVYQRTVSAFTTEDARLASAILNRMGEDTRVSDGTISSPRSSITVLPACSAFEYLWFFCAAVLAFPALASRKIAGILAGVTLLLALNLFRVVSLYYISVHFPRFFDMAHEEIWGIVLVLASVCLCAAWIGWVRKDGQLDPDVTA
ncbi:MAG: archaeosortase/exosortase family protein [Chthoniobacteraceae bacterium]